jgi:hypothetical protein
MRGTFLRVVAGVLACTALTVPSVAAKATVDRVEDFGSVLAVRFEDDFPLASLMRANCEWVQRTTHPDGSAVEKMQCKLSDEPVMIPAFQGTPPKHGFVLDLGPCWWISDYVAITAEEIQYASSVHLVVTPSGNVTATSFYPADPLECEE